jgi:nucleotide-binding universal stress UspA family protein
MKVLLATDGSETAMEPTKVLAEIARYNPVDAVVVTVSYDPPRYQFQPWAPEWTQQQDGRARAVLSDARCLLNSYCRSVSLVHVSGPVVPTILCEARKAEADVIVIGAKGHSTLRRLLLGSVSDSVASNSKCSVLVVRGNEDPKLRHVVIGYDKGVASREAVNEMMELRLDEQTHVDVVSIAEQPYVYVGEGFAGAPITLGPEHLRPIVESNERMASQIADSYPHTQAHTTVASHVGEAIVNRAASVGADLVVVGDTGHSMIGELILGSTSKYIIRHASCSVWISRHHTKLADPMKSDVSDQVESTHGSAAG